MEQVKPLYDDAPWAFDCICGPYVMGNGFWACYKNGKLTNNPPGEDGRYYVVCRRCGRIIDTETLYVIDRRNVSQIDDEIDNL